MSDKNYEGSCFCGAVAWTVSGDAEGMGYCHCSDCRSWSGGPVNAFTLWKPESFKFTKGEDKVKSFNKTPGSTRKWCSDCGGHILTDHPGMGLTDVFAASIPTFPHEAGVHVHYAETVLRMTDGVAKMKDMPAEAGGSGETLPE